MVRRDDEITGSSDAMVEPQEQFGMKSRIACSRESVADSSSRPSWLNMLERIAEARPNPMTINVWLENAVQDAERRGLPALRPLLEALARATSVLRNADWNADATGASTELRAGELDEPRGPGAR